MEVDAAEYKTAMRDVFQFSEDLNDEYRHTLRPVVENSGLFLPDWSLSNIGLQFFSNWRTWGEYLDHHGCTTQVVDSLFHAGWNNTTTPAKAPVVHTSKSSAPPTSTFDQLRDKLRAACVKAGTNNAAAPILALNNALKSASKLNNQTGLTVALTDLAKGETLVQGRLLWIDDFSTMAIGTEDSMKVSYEPSGANKTGPPATALGEVNKIRALTSGLDNLPNLIKQVDKVEEICFADAMMLVSLLVVHFESSKIATTGFLDTDLVAVAKAWAELCQAVAADPSLAGPSHLSAVNEQKLMDMELAMTQAEREVWQRNGALIDGLMGTYQALLEDVAGQRDLLCEIFHKLYLQDKTAKTNQAEVEFRLFVVFLATLLDVAAAKDRKRKPNDANRAGDVAAILERLPSIADGTATDPDWLPNLILTQVGGAKGDVSKVRDAAQMQGLLASHYGGKTLPTGLTLYNSKSSPTAAATVGPVTVDRAAIKTALDQMDLRSHAGSLVKFMLENNVKVPISFVLWTPHERFLAGSLLMCVPGPELGATFIGQSNWQLGKDIARKMIAAHYTCKLKSKVINPKLIAMGPNVLVKAYGGGAG